MPEEQTVPRSPLARLLFGLLLLLLFAAFSALGTWQVERLFWKLDLIDRVETRSHADPIAAPGRDQWSAINPDTHEYLRVRATGHFDYRKEVLVQASTERGPGFWVMTPLVAADGTAILINRGFVPGDRRRPEDRRAADISGMSTVIGLLRITEPRGALLRTNDPAAGRWYSRDVAAISAQLGQANSAPYFIDADATPNAGGLPVGGLTVVSFRNSHLVYAATWFGLALMVAGAGVYVVRSEFRRRPPHE